MGFDDGLAGMVKANKRMAISCLREGESEITEEARKDLETQIEDADRFLDAVGHTEKKYPGREG